MCRLVPMLYFSIPKLLRQTDEAKAEIVLQNHVLIAGY